MHTQHGETAAHGHRRRRTPKIINSAGASVHC
jgi:hypothetical protein